MPRVRRHDTTRLDALTRTPEGYLRAPGTLTRTGVFEYRRADGSVQRELRLDADVFDAQALASFHLQPLTRGHPSQNLDATNVRQHQVGTVAAPRKADDSKHVIADLVVMDADAVRAVEAGERELSCGYSCDLEPIAGGVFKHADGREERADYVQRGIRGNHVAIVPRGRAGSAAIRLDSEGHTLPEEQEAMKKIHIDGKDYEVADEVAAAWGRAISRGSDAAAAWEKDREKERADLERTKGELDVTKTKLATAEKARADAADPKVVTAAAKSLLTLVAKAAPSLPERKLDELLAMPEAELMRAVIAKEAPALKLDGASDDRVRGTFDALTASRVDTAGALARAAQEAKVTGAEHTDHDAQIEKLRRDAEQELKDAWRPKATA